MSDDMLCHRQGHGGDEEAFAADPGLCRSGKTSLFPLAFMLPDRRSKIAVSEHASSVHFQEN